MTIIRKILDTGFRIIDRGRPLAKLRPVLSAVDELFFGTDKVNSVPHISDYIDLKRYMTFVILGLVPAVAGAVYFWGLRVLLVIGVSYAFGGLIEVAFAIARKKEIHEGFLVTGLIFPLVLPPSIPLWAVALGSMFGVTFGKEVFGGTGRNIFNPAIVGRIFLSVCFPGIMTTTWPVPYSGGLGGFLRYGVDSLTLATPLTAFRSEHSLLPWVDLLWGQGGGCIGETFRLGIIIGGVFLLVTRISNWRIPLAYLGTILLLSCIGNGLAPERFAPPLFQLLSGGLLLGALFMATDPVTCPFTRGGKWIGGILLGVLTLLIRSISGYVEGVMFSILMINALSPLIDHIVLAIRYRR